MENELSRDFLDRYATLEEKVRRLQNREWDYYPLEPSLAGGWTAIGGAEDALPTGYWDTGTALIFQGWLNYESANLLGALPSDPDPLVPDGDPPAQYDAEYITGPNNAFGDDSTPADNGTAIPFNPRSEDFTGAATHSALRIIAENTNNSFWVRGSEAMLRVEAVFNGFRLYIPEVLKGGVPLCDDTGVTHNLAPDSSYWVISGVVPHGGRY